ncbi:NAD(P)H-dependent D-xylose reductase [Sodiomyces alkalinus F11]|uniref:NAD(P)H-dependent D-xylose reductase n=1 Tax=Sodiomyces alkalinus (strain CBS 110278 / VKM F-3762 / F11) TaxID=1314773 RepID=A0A3N2PW49_SODAK|nr:NAD(P)H-dependent D-xylose reductase [Sodiomyces alkalinus F11]ROT38733.1 NAD(P)H-dependent D-xylose reductase [Sodiomyces alkalinus F11]
MRTWTIISKIPKLKLASGYHIPQVGFGLWKIPPEQTANAVYHAIKAGYRHIDGAYGYKNTVEAGEGIRRAIREGLVSRADLFITSKLWNNYHARRHAIEMAHVETDAWGLDYLDLFLIHFPIAQQHIPLSESRFPGWYLDASCTRVTPRTPVPIAETWEALESLVAPPAPEEAHADIKGFLRSLGVSNFDAQLLYDLTSYARVPPSVLQVEHHPYLGQSNLLRAARDLGVQVTAYSTFGPQSFLELDNPRARHVVPLLQAEPVVQAAARLGRTPAQVLLRWCTQRGLVVIPKSVHPNRMAENLDCCSFDLAPEEMDAVSALDRGLRFNDPGVTHGSPLHIFS